MWISTDVGSLLRGATGVAFSSPPGTCQNAYAVWARSDGRAYASLENQGVAIAELDGGCVPFSTGADRGWAVFGIENNGVTEIYSARGNGDITRKVDPSAAVTRVWANPQRMFRVYDIHGLDQATLFAVGEARNGGSPQGYGRILKFDVANDDWVESLSVGNNDIFFAVHVVSTTLAYAAGSAGIYKWDGTQWSPFADRPNAKNIFGIRGLSSSLVRVVGVDAKVIDVSTSGFTVLNDFGSQTLLNLSRLKGEDACHTWAPGIGQVVSTQR